MGAPPLEFRRAVVPITTALNPGPWYTRLATYKAGRPDYQSILASLVYCFMAQHRLRIGEMLGGAWDRITIVPSKRGISYEQQPLRAALSLVEPTASKLAETLRFRHDQPIPRQQYRPQSFVRGPASCEGQRLVLIEDLWVSGATSLSAAGALLRDGASAVVILPIARLIDRDYWGLDHPYIQAMAADYDLSAWPR